MGKWHLGIESIPLKYSFFLSRKQMQNHSMSYCNATVTWGSYLKGGRNNVISDTKVKTFHITILMNCTYAFEVLSQNRDLAG
jgi:hypothetical protein